MTTEAQLDLPRQGWPVLAAAVLLVVVLLTHRFATGAGLGLVIESADGTGVVATGILEYPEDNAAYLSHAEQAKKGAWASVNSFAIDDDDRIYFNPLFLVVGNVAGMTGFATSGVLNVLALVAAFATVLLVARIALRLGMSHAAASWAAWLTAFGSGLSAVTAAISPGGSNAWVGVDRAFQDTLASSVFAVYPFQAVTLCVLAFAILVALRALQSGRGFDLGLLAFLGALSASLRPYECFMFLGTLWLHALWSAGDTRRKRLIVVGTAAAAIVPVVAYGFWVSRQEAWREYSEITIAMIDISRLAWVIGYGMFLPAAVIGMFFGDANEHRRWFRAWAVIMLTFLIVFRIDQVKLSSGFELPLAVLAGQGCAVVATHLRSRGQKLVGLGVAALFFPTTLHLMVNVYEPHTLDGGLVRIAKTIEASNDPRPRVLGERHVGQILPALTSAQVFVGHWSMTPSIDARRARLIRAGIEVDEFLDLPVRREDFDEMVASIEPDYLVLRESVPAVEFAHDAGWRDLGVWSGWVLLAIGG